MKITEKLIRDIIEQFLPCYGDNIPMIDFVIVGKNGTGLCGNGVPACIIGPVDGDYGMAINDDYIYEMDTLESLVLHELVHYCLLLEGKQKQGDDQHDEVFVKKAKEIEDKTGIDNIINVYGNSIWPLLRDKIKKLPPLGGSSSLADSNVEGEKICTRFENEKVYNYYIKYLKKYGHETGLKNWRFYVTNLHICNEFPVTSGENLMGVNVNEEVLIGF